MDGPERDADPEEKDEEVCEFLSPVSISAASAIPERSEPTLIEFAPNSAKATMISIQRGILSRNAPPSPFPVTMPMRAHMNCTQPISGQVMNAVQSSDVPSCAPATV